jgi:alanine racemase
MLRANACAWRAYAGVPLRAVVKSAGYGWGFARMVKTLEDLVDAFIVADMEEFDIVRSLTECPIVILAAAPTEHIGRLLAGGAIPDITSLAGIEAAVAWAAAAGRAARIRIGLCPAVGWSGFTFDALVAHISRLACPELDIELWTHLTHPALEASQRALFARVQGACRAAGVRVVAQDLESTVPLVQAHAASGSFVRLGIGLFGACYGGGPDGLRCAVRVAAPVVRCSSSAGQLVGYGLTRAPQAGYLLVVRCGYGDGFARVTGTDKEIIAVGMQYTTLWQERRPDTESSVLMDGDTDLDAFSRAAGSTPHEIVVRLGTGARLGGALA